MLSLCFRAAILLRRVRTTSGLRATLEDRLPFVETFAQFCGESPDVPRFRGGGGERLAEQIMKEPE